MSRLSWPVVGLLLVLDMLCVVAAFSLGYLLRFRYGVLELTVVGRDPTFADYTEAIVFSCCVFLVVFTSRDLYRRLAPRGFEVLQESLTALNIATILVLAATFFYREFSYSRSTCLLAWGFLAFTLPVPRLLLMRRRRRRYAQGEDLLRVLIVGTAEAATELSERLQERKLYGLEIVGLLTDVGASPCERQEPPVLGSLSDLKDVVEAEALHEVLISDSLPRLQLLELVEVCARNDVEARVVPRLYDLFVNPGDLSELYGVPFISVRESRREKLSLAFKRLFDLAVAVPLLLLALPVIGILAVAIRLESKGPALFRQERIGEGGRRFGMWKLRSMVVDAEALRDILVDVTALEQPVYKLVHDPRVTGLGRVLRRWSLDELPQLWNVVRGDMSLVGPRPEEVSIVKLYNAHHRRRLNAKPGLTGLQQVEARATGSLDQRIQLDVYYLRNRTLLFDLWLLARTPWTVLHGRGAR